MKHLQAVVFLPVTVTVVIPAILIADTGSVNIGWSLPPPFIVAPVAIGALLIGLGLVLLVNTIALFATLGQGTLAPWAPTQNLVVGGVYQYVRNPMISSVSCILLGEAALFGRLPLLGWFLVFLSLNFIYIPLVEEPGLERRFGETYVRYKQHVPRWIPRTRPWSAPPEEQESSVRF